MKPCETHKKNHVGANQPGKGKDVLVLLAVVLLIGMAILFMEYRYRGEIAQNPKTEAKPVSAPLAAPAIVADKPVATAVQPEPVAFTSAEPIAGATTKTAVVKASPNEKIQAVADAAVNQGPTLEHKIVQDPAARDALTLVGVDSDAEDYWLDAINDQSLPKPKTSPIRVQVVLLV